MNYPSAKFVDLDSVVFNHRHSIITDGTRRLTHATVVGVSRPN